MWSWQSLAAIGGRNCTNTNIPDMKRRKLYWEVLKCQSWPDASHAVPKLKPVFIQVKPASKPKPNQPINWVETLKNLKRKNGIPSAWSITLAITFVGDPSSFAWAFFSLPLILRFLRLLWSLLCRVLPLSNQLNWNNDQNNVWILCKLGLILFKHHQENDDCAGTITAWGFSYAHCQKKSAKKNLWKW